MLMVLSSIIPYRSMSLTFESLHMGDYKCNQNPIFQVSSISDFLRSTKPTYIIRDVWYKVNPKVKLRLYYWECIPERPFEPICCPAWSEARLWGVPPRDWMSLSSNWVANGWPTWAGSFCRTGWARCSSAQRSSSPRRESWRNRRESRLPPPSTVPSSSSGGRR